MWRDCRIEFVAPPFAGHLFPLLDLAQYLRREGMTGLRVLSTASAADAIGRCELPAVELLPGCAEHVEAIANTTERVGFHPLRLYRQFRMNVQLMARLRTQLRELWSAHRPDLVIADFTVPIAGLLAQEMGIRWWTSMPSPCALETRTGTPAYLGGWMPREDWLGRLRDALGRRLVRLFKLGVATLFARELRALSVPRLYRQDGSEIIYSPECILALGMREFEFERDWPEAVRFIGPLIGGPPCPHTAPEFPPGKRCILVTLGTHLPWARDRARAFLEAVAERMPECVFHFALGKPGATEMEVRGNLHIYSFIPYDEYLPRYAAAIIHGGTGITYSCIKAGVPMLVWPHDYDQFDHAARIVAHGLGQRLVETPARAAADLEKLLQDAPLRLRVFEFQRIARQYNPHRWVAEALEGISRMQGTLMASGGGAACDSGN